MSRVTAENRDGRDTQYQVCSNPTCGNNFKISHWDNKRAQREGWFLQKNGDSWCPEHTPEWLDAWREKMKANDSI
jgi:hypothetical protein